MSSNYTPGPWRIGTPPSTRRLERRNDPEQEKELLTLAAKACGFIFNPTITDCNLWGCFEDDRAQTAYAWNPLHSPGDCAEMEDKLMIHINWSKTFIAAESYDYQVWVDENYADHNNDRGAARRLASTRVAAEIQRRKQAQSELEQYKGECVRLTTLHDQLRGEIERMTQERDEWIACHARLWKRLQHAHKAIEAMRVAGGSEEFQVAFDAAKGLVLCSELIGEPSRDVLATPEETSDCHGPDWTERDGEYLK